MPAEVDRLVNLAVGTKTDEEYAAAYKLLSDIGGDLALTYSYASVSVFDRDDPDDVEITEQCPEEHLHYDENTMNKVHQALCDAIPGLSEASAVGIITRFQNAGILFRERKESTHDSAGDSSHKAS